MDSRHSDDFQQLKIFLDENGINISLENLPESIAYIANRFVQENPDKDIINRFFDILAKILMTIPDIHPYFSSDLWSLMLNFYDDPDPSIVVILFLIIEKKLETKILSELWTLSIQLQLRFFGLIVMSLPYILTTFKSKVFEWINYIIYMLIQQETKFTSVIASAFIFFLIDYFKFQSIKYALLEFNILGTYDSILPILNKFLMDKHKESKFWHAFVNDKDIYSNFCRLFESVFSDDGCLLLKYFLLYNRNLRIVLTLHKCPKAQRLWDAISKEMTDILFGRTQQKMTSSQLALLSGNIKILYHTKFKKSEDMVRPYLDVLLKGQRPGQLSRFVRERLEQGSEQWPHRMSIFGDEKQLLDLVLSIRDPDERLGYIKKIRTFQKALSAKKQLSRRDQLTERLHKLRLSTNDH